MILRSTDSVPPEPTNSRAVLIGVSTYEKLPNLPSVRNNLSGLAAILRDPDVWGIPAENCKVVLDPSRTAHLIDAIALAAEQATDTLLVYYAGHGLTDLAGELHLTIPESEANKPYSQVLYQWVRDPIRDSPARRRILILDCCYSGRATDQAMGTDEYAAQADIDGSFVLTATPENRKALAPADQLYTAFTSELITILEEGLIGHGELISLNDIFGAVRARLRSQSRPQPQTRDRNNLGSHTYFRNKAYLLGSVMGLKSVEHQDAESQTAMRYVHEVCMRSSARFLHQERLPWHDQLYISRPLDQDIQVIIHSLRPINLRRLYRTSRSKNESNSSGEIVPRAKPSQIAVISDNPGTGKTMLAVQLSRYKGVCGTVLRHVSEATATDLRMVLEELGQDQGLTALLAARMPLVYVVDALDRADYAANHKQIINLFKLVEQLNVKARKLQLLAFPIIILFTLRETEWDRWFTLFEGRNIVQFRRVIPKFTPEQLTTTLQQYTIAYDYSLRGYLSPALADTLALPLNMRFLSESYQFRGQIEAAEALAKPLLAAYIQRKAKQSSRFLPWLGQVQLTTMLADLAMAIIKEGAMTIQTNSAMEVVIASGGMTKEDAAKLLRILRDENVLEEDRTGLRFSYPALLEYFLAVGGVRNVSRSGKVEPLEDLTIEIANSSISLEVVRSNAQVLVRSERLDTQQIVNDFYSNSPVYVGARLRELRALIASGGTVPEEDLAAIYGSLNNLQGEDAWYAFFVVVALNNHQPIDRLIDVFRVAWDTNSHRPDRWKLLSKMQNRGLLYCNEVVSRVLRNSEPQTWETFLGWLVHEPNPQKILAKLSTDAGQPIAQFMGNGPEWCQAWGLLNVVIKGDNYVEGQVW